MAANPRQLGRLAEIQALFQRAFDRHRQGKLDEADRLYRQVLARDPAHVDALHFRGLILIQAQNYAPAVELITKAIAVSPGTAALYVNRATALARLERRQDAIEDYQRAIALEPALLQAHLGLADAAGALGDPAAALAAFDSAITLKPDHAGAHLGRGSMLNALGRIDLALTSFDAALSIAPDNALVHFNRGTLLRKLGRLDAAIASFNRAIALTPDFVAAHHNNAACLLQTGDFEAGFSEYEWRKKSPDHADPRQDTGVPWTGAEPLAGKTLFIYPELYLGDLIQFSRYALMAQQSGAHVILAAPDALHALLTTLSPAIELIGKHDSPAVFDYQAALMSLPQAFRTTVGAIPAPIPYLAAEPARIERWRARLGGEGFRIGVCWQGSTLAYAAPMQRSFALAHLEGLSKIPGVRLISLQKHEGLDQLQNLPDGMAVETLGEDFDAGPAAFLDTAAVMQSLDLVVTPDTAVAHLAGALGVRAFVALPFVTDWRWLLDRDDSPWHPSLRLFRQPASGDWDALFAEMTAAVAQLAA